jgi:hypothetical protein
MRNLAWPEAQDIAAADDDIGVGRQPCLHLHPIASYPGDYNKRGKGALRSPVSELRDEQERLLVCLG